MTTRIRIELASPMGVALGLGPAAGVVLGIVAGLPGVAIGLAFGAVVGLVAGTALQRTEGLFRAARGRELDAIIGVSGGDLGAAPVRRNVEDPEVEVSWAEWLTLAAPRRGLTVTPAAHPPRFQACRPSPSPRCRRA